VCPQERLVIISKQTGLSFVLKRIGPLAAIVSLAFYLLVLYSSITSKPLEYLFVSIYSESFIETAANTFCSSLGSTFLLIEDTTIHPLYLWVINNQHETQRGHKRCSHLIVVFDSELSPIRV